MIGAETRSGRRVAALDLGSNSFHLLVADVASDGTITPVLRKKEMLRLGDTVARTGRIGDRIPEVVATLRRLRSLIDATGAESVVTCATAALRDAADQQEVVERAAAEAGVEIRVISGVEEARLIFEAVRASVVLDPPPALCLDLGGGSLEITVGDAEKLHWVRSVPLGVARLTADWITSDPPIEGDLERLRAAVAAELDPVLHEIQAHAPRMLVGTSGTLGDLAAIAVARRHGTPPRTLNQVAVSRDELSAVHDELTAMTTVQRRDVQGLDRRRAEVVVAGSTLLLAALDIFGMAAMTVGEWALREGMLLDAAGYTQPASGIRRSSVLDLGRRYGWPERHSRHVAALGVSVFDQTAGMHGLAARERELLDYGALLHDIGGHVSAENVEQHTAYLIEHGRLRGFDPDEIAMLACLGRYHRRGKPRPGFAPYDRLGADNRRSVDVLVALLRLAHGLDHARAGSVESVSVSTDNDEVTVMVARGDGDGDVDLELWGGERAGKSFARAFGRRLRLEVAPSDV